MADANLGLIWRINVRGKGSERPKVWTDDPLLQRLTPSPGFRQPNGIRIFQDEVYVSVSIREHIVAIPIKWDGSAGKARVHATVGVDDFAFDKKGNMYARNECYQ